MAGRSSRRSSGCSAAGRRGGRCFCLHCRQRHCSPSCPGIWSSVRRFASNREDVFPQRLCVERLAPRSARPLVSPQSDKLEGPGLSFAAASVCTLRRASREWKPAGLRGELIEWLAIVSESTCVQSDCRHRAAILRSRIVNAAPHRRQRGIQKGRRYTKSRPCPSVGGSVERFRVHDLRRTVRSGLARLQVPEHVACAGGGTNGSNLTPSSVESTNRRFLGGGAGSAVCHELY